LNIAKLREELSNLWIDGRSAAYTIFIGKVCLMFLNLVLVYTNAFQPPHGANYVIYDSRFSLIRRLMVWTEFVVVWLSGFRVLVDAALICGMRGVDFCTMRPAQMAMLATNVEVAAGFSLLEFLPVPAKIFYWWNHRHRIWNEQFTQPPVMHGYSIWKPEELMQAIQKYSEENNCPVWYKIIIAPGLFVCFFVIQVAVPIFLVVAPVLAFPAFLVKMADLSDVTMLGEWDVTSWIHALGVVNQVSKMWNSEFLQKTIALQAAQNMIDQQAGQGRKTKSVREELPKALCTALGPRDGTVMISVMSVGDIIEILNRATF